MSDVEETVGTESHFVENTFSIKTLLCLTTSDNVEGTPISKTESLRRHLPIRVFGVIQCIEDSTNFSISLMNDPRNFSEFKFHLNRSYSDPVYRQDVSADDLENGGLYVCRILKEYFRCRLLKSEGYTCTVYLIDLGVTKTVNIEDLSVITFEFHGEQYFNYAFAFRCSTPDPEYLKTLTLPSLEEFVVGDVVDVVICSLHEPALAIIGSTCKHFSRLHPEFFVDGLDEFTRGIWQSNFLSPLPSFLGVTTGQYPAAQPTISDDWILATVAACNSLASVHVRDISSSVRLSVLQEILNDFYGDDECRAQMTFAPGFTLTQDLPCIIFDDLSKQYLRAKVVRLSGDRSVADIVGVDYPSVFFQAVERKHLFMLSEKMFLPPQCFSIQLVTMEDDLNLRDYTQAAKHFIEVGSVVSVCLSAKSTIAIMKVADGDILDKIGLKKAETDLCEKLPTPPKFRPSPLRNYSAASSISSMKAKSIAAKGGKQRVPLGSTEAFVVTVNNANAIYYRTRAEATNFATIQKRIAAVQEALIPLHMGLLEKQKAGKKYLLRYGATNELYRVKIISNELEKKGDLRYIRLDDGEYGDFYVGTDQLYSLPFDLEKPAPAVIGPRRLAKPSWVEAAEAPEFDKVASDMRVCSKLRLLMPNNGRCLVIEERINHNVSRTITSPRVSAEKSMSVSDSPKKAASYGADVLLYRNDDNTNINEEYFTMLRTFLKDQKENKNWHT